MREAARLDAVDPRRNPMPFPGESWDATPDLRLGQPDDPRELAARAAEELACSPTAPVSASAPLMI